MKKITKVFYTFGLIAIISAVVHDYILWRDYSQLAGNLAIGIGALALAWIYETVKAIQKEIHEHWTYTVNHFLAYGEQLKENTDRLNELEGKDAGN